MSAIPAINQPWPEQGGIFIGSRLIDGLVRQSSASHNEQALICRALLKRGHAVEGLHLSKAFRKHH